jgi:hypothetical protein
MGVSAERLGGILVEGEKGSFRDISTGNNVHIKESLQDIQK